MLNADEIRRLIEIIRNDGADAVARRNAAQLLWLRFPEVPEDHVQEALAAISHAVPVGTGSNRAFPYEED
jgi:hypothetical protein